MRLVLIDGHAILHRAFHALPPLTTSQGEPVGATFGFCSMLLRVIKDLKPKYLAVVFDLPKPTFRQAIFAAYQAQRPPMAEELTGQVDLIHKVLETMEIPIFEVEGYEADDVIATLATQALKMRSSAILSLARQRKRPCAPQSGARDTVAFGDSRARLAQEQTAARTGELEVIVVSGDRDMFQLIGERVKVLVPVVGITKMVLYDQKAVEEKYGLKPYQWVDFKALVGDPSDNFPGVSGIGPKTATDLLKKYGTLENIYQNLEELPEKLAKSLAEGKETVDLAKKLAQLTIDIPSVKLDLGKCQLKNLANPRVEKLFREFEFKSLLERLKIEAVQKRPKKPKGKKKENNQLSLLQ